MVLGDPTRRAEYLDGRGGKKPVGSTIPTVLDAETSFLKGEVLLRRGDHAKAIEFFAAASKANPGEPQYRPTGPGRASTIRAGAKKPLCVRRSGVHCGRGRGPATLRARPLLARPDLEIPQRARPRRTRLPRGCQAGQGVHRGDARDAPFGDAANPEKRGTQGFPFPRGGIMGRLFKK